MFRHVLCVYPYRVELRNKSFYPPLGLETIAAVLEPHAEAIDVVDLRREERRTADFLRSDTDLVCFSVNWGKEHAFIRNEIRSVPQRTLTIVGGRHATEDPEKWLSDCPNVDILVRGDGEETIQEIVERRPLDRITGISFRLNGKLVHGPVRHPGPVADHIYPNRRLRRYAYSVIPGGHRGLPTIDCVASSRGCPFNCTFCSYNRNPWGKKRNWNARSPESVVRELEQIDAEVVLFVDDNFAHDMERVGAICDLITARGIRKRYGAQVRVEIAKRPDVLRKMERAGFSLLALGIESAQDKTLRSMKKGFNTQQLREYFHVLGKSSMILHGFFIVGNIGETEEDMLWIAPFARELGLDMLSMTRLRHLAYDGLEELVSQSPGYHIASNGRIYSDEYQPRRLREIRDRINRSFYTPGCILRLLSKGLRNGLLTPSLLASVSGLALRKALKHRRRTRAKQTPPGPSREARVPLRGA
jgi:radical SAM superfamily enzyme YgiQ (UPF0313 family)